MRVQRVVPPGGGAESWTVIGADLRPVEPVERYLAWLSRIERAPTTVRAYAHDLKTFWEFVESRGIEWERISLEQLGEFTAWLRSPAENVVVLATGRPARASSTVNRILTAVFGFYEFHARHGVEVVRALVDERRSGRGSFKPFLYGIAPSRPRGRVGRLREERRLPATLAVDQVAAILAAQTRLRDRFLFALLAGTGMRIGQALGLRHCDVVCQERRIEIVSRADNANGARGKRSAGWVPITPELVRLHSDYMHREYGDLDSDYVFVNLWGGRVGHAMSYHAVDEIVRRTRGRVGFHFTPHQLRHTYATVVRRGGVPVEIVSKLLCHRSVQTTSDIYLHASPEDLRAELERAGVLERDETLDRLPDLTTRTAVVILIETGLRSIDCLRLPFDPITTDEAGAPYLKFLNHKLSREAIIPISERLVSQIRAQQQDLRERFPAPPPFLLPALRQNPDGTRPFLWSALNNRLRNWLADCDIRDAAGRPVRVTAHQFRHTVGTRMINNDVSMDTVQRMLDHASPEMTARYATIKDQTLRREWEHFQQRINIQGELIPLDPAGSPQSDAAWALENLARAKQTLPNGYCGLPLQQTCPHPNACLTCDSFLTTIEFLDQHRDQLTRTEQLIAQAEADGRRRLVEMNEPVRLNLIRIIDGLEALEDHDAG